MRQRQRRSGRLRIFQFFFASLFRRREDMTFHYVPRALVCAFALLSAGRVLPAADGVILIDQKAALSGKVTPLDTAGFPVTISEPGSYRLSGNLTVADAASTAIQITADNVTLDLNGFTISGP